MENLRLGKLNRLDDEEKFNIRYVTKWGTYEESQDENRSLNEDEIYLSFEGTSKYGKDYKYLILNFEESQEMKLIFGYEKPSTLRVTLVSNDRYFGVRIHLSINNIRYLYNLNKFLILDAIKNFEGDIYYLSIIFKILNTHITDEDMLYLHL